MSVQDGDTAVCGGDRGEPGRGSAAIEEGDQGDHRCGEPEPVFIKPIC